MKSKSITIFYLSAILMLSSCSNNNDVVITEAISNDNIIESATEIYTEPNIECSDINTTTTTSLDIAVVTNESFIDYVPNIVEPLENCHYLFDNDELINKMDSASYIYYTLFLNVSPNSFENKGTIITSVSNGEWEFESQSEFIKTGISYDSFVDYLLDTFTEDYVFNTLLQRNTYIEVSGELCYYPYGDYIYNNCFDSISFDIIEQTNDLVTIKGIAKYVDIDDSNVTWENEFTYSLYYTNGWKLNNFNEWK